MSPIVLSLFLPFVILLCLSTNATPVSTEGFANRSAVVLTRPLSQGGTNLDAPTLGRLVYRLLAGDEVPELNVEDRAAVLASFMNVWRVKKPAKDSALAILDKTLAPIRKDFEFDDFPDNGKLRKSYARLQIAFLVVEAHRKITSLEENQPLREIFAHLAVGLILSTFEQRLTKTNIPDDAQIIAILSKIGAGANPESRVVWWQVVERLRHGIDGSLDKTVRRSLSDASAVAGLGGLFLGGTAAVVSLVTDTTEMIVGRGNDLLVFATFLSTPFVGAFAGVKSMSFFAPRMKRRIRGRGHAFVEACHADLVQAPPN